VGRPFLWDAHRCAPHATNPGDGTGMSPRTRTIVPPPAAPIRSCSRWGLPCRPCCQERGALLPHRFTLARHRPRERGRGRAVCFLWHCPWGRPRRPLTGTVFPWSPDFPPPQVVRQRPSSRLAPGFCEVARSRSRPLPMKSRARRMIDSITQPEGYVQALRALDDNPDAGGPPRVRAKPHERLRRRAGPRPCPHRPHAVPVGRAIRERTFCPAAWRRDRSPPWHTGARCWAGRPVS
jgi:hypothetical protein